MKKIAFLHKTFLLVAMIGFAMTGYAQQYEVDHGKVYFDNELLMYADARSFKDLGYGYAKDHYNVYLNGQVLENVDPSTFRLKHSGSWRHREDSQVEPIEPPARRGYFKTNFNVYYGDKKIDAMPSTPCPARFRSLVVVMPKMPLPYSTAVKKWKVPWPLPSNTLAKATAKTHSMHTSEGKSSGSSIS